MCLVMLASGLLWHERAVLIVPTLLGVAIVLADDRRGWRRVPGALRRWWPLWLGCAAVLGSFLVGARRAHHGRGRRHRGQGGAADLVELRRRERRARSAGRSVGGRAPRRCGAALGVGHGGGLRLAVALVRAARPPGWAVGPVGRGRPGRVRPGGPRAGARRSRRLRPDHRPRPALLLRRRARGGRGGGARAAWRAAPLRARRRRRTVAGAAPARGRWPCGGVPRRRLVRPRPCWSRTSRTPRTGQYVTNVRAGLAADPNAVLVDALAPADVVLPLVGDDSRLSRILAPLPESPAFDQPSPRLRVVDEQGRLQAGRAPRRHPERGGPDPGLRLRGAWRHDRDRSARRGS